MRNTRHVWLLFLAGAAVVFGALGWVSEEVLRLDAAARQARRAARLEENVRLALWRMDTQATQFLAARLAEGTVVPTVPPEAAPPGQELVAYNFQVDPQNNFSFGSETPVQTLQTGAQTPPQTEGTARPQVDTAGDAAPPGAEALNYKELTANLDRPDPTRAATFPGGKQVARMRYSDSPKAQHTINMAEFNNRIISNAQMLVQQAPMPQVERAPAGPLRAMWVGPRLVLARRRPGEDDPIVEGAVLDWPALREELLAGIRTDLLPEARLVPVRADESADPARAMASLPLELVPGAPPAAASGGPGRTAVVVLAAAWGAVLLATLAAAASLHSVLQLSERRADFVSAVTHELRTPLTTFRMYTEMLAEGMVEESKRAHYLATLHAEADRLGHLVENVLSYARLERSPTAGRTQTLPLGEALDRTLPRLTARAAESEMELAVHLSDEARASRVKTDPDALEHILLNLVDNACKYAARAEDRRIHLRAAPQGRRMRLELRDHGPGVPAEDAGRIFRPFRKSAREAARTAPGVGLGLALSRRMARHMGGDLRLAPGCPSGACFVLTLPRA